MRSYEQEGRSVVLEALLGSLSCERVLVFICAREVAYAREIARFYDADLAPIQKQLEKLEFAGVLVSRTAGRTRLYEWNPRYAFLKELRSLLEKAITFYEPEDRERLVMTRLRPRRKGKPL
jgi:hypothetical protein